MQKSATENARKLKVDSQSSLKISNKKQKNKRNWIKD